MIGGGLSGQLALEPLKKLPSSSEQTNLASLQDLAVGPGVAPWAAGRVGIPGSNEAGLTYAGRELRVDVRHAFPIGKAALSLGLGASAIMPKAPSGGDPKGVLGGGADVPLLIGVRSSADIYAFWFGPRAGFQVFTGQVQLAQGMGAAPLFDVTGKQFYAGLTAGTRVGFRHVHLALEINAAYHAGDGSFRLASPVPGPPPAGASSSVQQISLTPAGALEVDF